MVGREAVKLESQVCSLELAKRLKELGVKQESLFIWSAWVSHSPEENTDCHDLHWEVVSKEFGNPGWYSAFNVAELGEILPTECVMQGENRGLGTTRNS